jgi:hypothetical protein
VRFKPTTSRSVTGKITVTVAESDSASPPSFRGRRLASISVNLAGTAPEFVYTYVVQPNGNSTALTSGAAIKLPDVNLAETASVAVTLTNRGTAPGVVNGITLKGSSTFELAGVPFPPITVEAGKSFVFSVRHTPDELDAVSASVKIDFASGPSLSFTVTGGGLGAEFTYELLTAKGPVPIDPNATLTLPDAVAGGDKTTLTIRVSNVGNADARIAAVSAAGTGFAVAESPFLPYTAVAGTSFTVVVSYTPAQPGKSTGRLRIGADNFNLEGTTVGSNLTFSYTAGGGATTIQSAGTVVFSPALVGGTSTVQVTARNEGTAPTLINSISVTGTGTTFGTASLPALPARLAAGASVTFSVTFSPVTTGVITGTLRIDTNTFTLSGAAGPPAALPDYSFQGGTATIEAQQQPAIGLSLNTAYPLALNGTLTLTFTSDVFANDPAVQFASGGRTLNFTIPANSRQAVFPNGATQMRVQSGTVAGTITLTPSFVTTAGAIDLTPTAPASLSMRMAQAAPQLLSVVLSTRTASGFTLLVTGFATGRSITQMDFQFAPTAGENVRTTRLSLNVEPTFLAWYQSTASQTYGSLFTATVPFTLAGDLTIVTELAATIQSVSVTLTNRQGVTAAKTVDIR